MSEIPKKLIEWLDNAGYVEQSPKDWFIREDGGTQIAIDLRGDTPKVRGDYKTALYSILGLLAKGCAANGKCTHSDPCVFAFGREDCQGCSCDLTVFPHAYPWANLKGMTKISDFVDDA